MTQTWILEKFSKFYQNPKKCKNCQNRLFWHFFEKIFSQKIHIFTKKVCFVIFPPLKHGNCSNFNYFSNFLEKKKQRWQVSPKVTSSIEHYQSMRVATRALGVEGAKPPAGGAGGRSPPDKQINGVKGRSPLWVVKGEALKYPITSELASVASWQSKRHLLVYIQISL